MSRPDDFSDGLKRYLEFHKLDPKRTGQLKGLYIPGGMNYVGAALFTAYRSDKWENEAHNYWHDHESGVRVYRSDTDGIDTDVPAWLRQTTTLVRLGTCLGIGYMTKDSVVEMRPGRSRPDLFCTPNGRALLIVDHRPQIVAMLWGGHLDVTGRGIVG